MRFSQSLLPKIRLAGVLIVAVVSAVTFGLLWTGGGGSVPFLTPDPYRVSLAVPDVNNLVDGSDVTMAGVPIGRVAAIESRGDKAIVRMEIEPEYAPLHDGASAQFREKTLVGETYIDFTDGDGADVPEDGVIPAAQVTPVVKLDDVLHSLDKPTRQALSSGLRALGTGTDGTAKSLSAALDGAGMFGKQGKTALAALAEQTTSLERLAANTTRVLDALDTRQGQIAHLVGDADRLTKATSGSSTDIQQAMRQMPGFLEAAGTASGSITELAPALRPVAANLKEAAPGLDKALRLMPATARDLRGLLPYLDDTLGKGPATLDRAPAVAGDLLALLPNADRALDSLNPMLKYIQPYGPDMVTYFTNFGQTIARGDANGTMLRVMGIFNEQSLKNHPLRTNDVIDRNEAFPPPGGQAKQPDRSPLAGSR